ncbi:MAG: AMP-binding protein [Lentisphaerota bacterium]
MTQEPDQSVLLLSDHHKEAIFWKDQAFSFSDVLAQSAAWAGRYSSQPGQRVAIFAENRPEWIFVLYSAWRHHSIVVPIDQMSSAPEVAFILRDAAPEVVFCSERTEPVLKEALAGLSPAPRLVRMDQTVGAGDATDLSAFAADQTALLLYTSGTTGKPKGVMLSFGNLAANLQAVTQEVPIFTPKSKVYALLPFHHILPMVGCVLAPLYIGSTVIMAHSLDPADMIHSMQRHRATLMIGVPRLYSLIRKGIMDKVRARGVSRFLFHLSARIGRLAVSRALLAPVQRRFGGRLRTLVSGGAPLDIEVARDLWALGFEVLEGFGMTEAAPMITFPRPGHVRLGSTGQPLQPNSVRIQDGEVLARGTNIMQGYWNRPEETREALEGVWLHTGDLGYLDQDQYLFITGRKKELLVLSNGKKVNPNEIESKLLDLSDSIREVGVCVKDDALHALIVPNPDRMGNLNETGQYEHFRWKVVDVYNRGVPPSRKIRQLTLIQNDLPKTRLGKLKRFELPALAIGQKAPDQIAPSNEPATPEFEALRNYLCRDLECESIRPSDHWDMDLGLDSLARVSLLVFVEKTYGVKLEETAFRDFPTVQSFYRHIESHKQHFEPGQENQNTLLKTDAPLDLPHSGWLHLTLMTGVRWILRAFFRITTQGAEGIPSGPLILAPNHQSFFDGFLVSSCLSSSTLSHTYFYAKEKHVRPAWRRFIARRSNVIVVDIERDLKVSLQKLAQVLRNGDLLMIFPEGTRSPDGKLGEFKRTFARLSTELKVPIMPVAISGAHRALPRGGHLPRPFTRIDIRFLAPIAPGSMDEETLAEKVQQTIAENLRL